MNERRCAIVLHLPVGLSTSLRPGASAHTPSNLNDWRATRAWFVPAGPATRPGGRRSHRALCCNHSKRLAPTDDDRGTMSPDGRGPTLGRCVAFRSGLLTSAVGTYPQAIPSRIPKNSLTMQVSGFTTSPPPTFGRWSGGGSSLRPTGTNGKGPRWHAPTVRPHASTCTQW